MVEVGCWAHYRRHFFEIAKAQSKPGLAAHALQWIARLYAIESRIKDHTPNIKVANRGAAGAELYRLYLAIGKMLDDPRRVLKARQRLHLGMEVSYIGGIPLAPPSHGTVVELRQTQAVIQDNQSRQRGRYSMRRLSLALRAAQHTRLRRHREHNERNSSLATPLASPTNI
ncbi:IS66 family transposase [Paraburkholderia sediminicola]|uniref:IS66 family transposase n=1 Tax=Paraburkholderia sediminicola TaxID=458836 RepID=UPI0038B7DAF6